MRKALLLIQNIATQASIPAEGAEWIGVVRENLEEVFAAIAQGEVR
jgi:hypothetical protein